MSKDSDVLIVSGNSGHGRKNNNYITLLCFSQGLTLEAVYADWLDRPGIPEVSCFSFLKHAIFYIRKKERKREAMGLATDVSAAQLFYLFSSLRLFI